MHNGFVFLWNWMCYFIHGSRLQGSKNVDNKKACFTTDISIKRYVCFLVGFPVELTSYITQKNVGQNLNFLVKKKICANVVGVYELLITFYGIF